MKIKNLKKVYLYYGMFDLNSEHHPAFDWLEESVEFDSNCYVRKMFKLRISILL